MISFIKKSIKKVPLVKEFIRYHNPGLMDMIKYTRIIDKENPVFIDVGANMGQSIDLFLNSYPHSKIYSFEPTIRLLSRLKKRYNNYSNIHIVDVALSDFDGETVFYTSDFSPTNSLFKPNIIKYEEQESSITNILEKTKEEKCMVKTFSNWYKENMIDEQIDLMKIDVQGAEYNVLSGCKEILSKKIKAVTVELQYLDFYTGSKMFFEVIDLMYNNNFFLYNFFENNKTSKNQLLENNAFFINKSYFK